MTFKALTHPIMLLALFGLLVSVQSGCGESQRLADEALAEQMAAENETIAQAWAQEEDAWKERKDAKVAAEAEKQSSGNDQGIPAGGTNDESDSDLENQADDTKVPEKPTIEIGDNWTRLSKTREIWIDKKKKEVMFSGHVCLRDGALEMFICPARTKEHESVIAASCQSQEIHFSLELVDIRPGKPCAWDPEYRPAHGPTIEATIKWRDKATQKTKSQNAKEWIRNVRTKKPMDQKWIFGGSTFWKDPDTGDEVYYADAGELICLSNFSTAMIDVGVESSQSNDGLLFETLTENIPPLGTKVYVVLKAGPPVLPEKKVVKKPDDTSADKTQTENKEGDKTEGDKTEPDKTEPDSNGQ